MHSSNNPENTTGHLTRIRSVRFCLKKKKKKKDREVVLRWQRNRTGDHFLPHKFIKRSFECWATSTKQLLNDRGRYQAPRKAAYSLWKEVGQNIKDKKTKELGMETRPGEGAVKKEEFPNRKPSHNWVCGEFWDLRGQHNWEETKQNKTKQNTE